MRWLSLLFLAFLISCGQLPSIQAPAGQVSVPDLVSKTVALVDESNEGIRPYCSGVWVSDTVIATANHCVDDLKIGELVTYVTSGDVYNAGELAEKADIVARRANLLSRDEAHDLALLAAAYPPWHLSATVSMSVVRQGQRTFTMGHPLGVLWSYSSGEVSGVRYVTSHGHSILFVQTTAPISPGNSGGGLFDERGELLGIAHATFNGGQNMNLYIHYQFLDALLTSSIEPRKHL